MHNNNKQMMKISLPLLVLCSSLSYSQVGINNTDPKATLDITARTTDASKPEGLIAPRLTGDQIRGKNTQYDIPQTGTIIYATAADSSPAGKTANITAPGYYYFDGGVWQKITTGASGGSGNTIYTSDGTLQDNRTVTMTDKTLSFNSSATAGTSHFNVDGNTLNIDAKNHRVGIGTFSPGYPLDVMGSNSIEGLAVGNTSLGSSFRGRISAQGSGPNDRWMKFSAPWSSTGRSFGFFGGVSGTELMTLMPNGQIGINSPSPDASAQLDIISSNKGVLLPRIALTSSTDQSTITSPATGLLVYNTGAAGLTYKGYVFWNGSEWRIFNNISSSTGTIGSITCTDVTMTPNQYTSGSAFNGTMNVPYTGGNGGTYPAQSVGPVNGLTANLAAGNFANGSGSLQYSVTGTPTVTSPSTTTFNLNIGGQTCSATVGQGTSLAVGQQISQVYSVPIATASTSGWRLGSYVTTNGLPSLPTIDGLQMDLLGYDSNYYDPIIENISSSAKLVSFQTFATQVNENRTRLNISVSPCPFGPTTFSSNLWDGALTAGWFGVDSNNIVFWSTSNAEVETTNLQVQIDANTYRWYEFKWWCMEVSGFKKIFMSVKRVV